MFTHLYEIAQHRAKQWPDAVALGSQEGDTWKTVNSRQLLSLVDGLAEDLKARGLKEGDRVVLWTPSSWRTPVFFFAIWKLGAIIVPFDREMNPEACAKIIQSVEPRFVIVGHDERPPWAQASGAIQWWEPQAATGPVSAWQRPSEELAGIFFTSGTTGNPKGCMISHTNLCSQIAVAPQIIPVDPTCRLASILPLSHLFELTGGLLYALSQGVAIHYIPSRRGPDILRVFQEQKATHMLTVPQMLTMMGRTIDDQLKAKLPGFVYRTLNWLAERTSLPVRRRLFFMIHRKLGGHLVMLISGGAALPPETQRLWEKLGVPVVQGYGSSECSPVVCAGTPDGSTPYGSVGKPIPGVEVKLSPEGELMAKGPNVMRGYWKDPVQTAEVLHDGWYSTGDLASVDKDGNYYITGRVKDLIVLPSGMKVWPTDVEEVLMAEPEVKAAAVMAVKTPAGGAMLHAYLIPAAGRAAVDMKELLSRSNARLAQHQRVATASWWPEPDFPRTSLLKVRRHLLPPPEKAEVVDVPVAQNDVVAQAILKLTGLDAVRSSHTLNELGIDSMVMVELALALETATDKAVGEDVLRLDMTVDEVRAVLVNAPEAGSLQAFEISAGDKEIHRVGDWPYTWGRIFRVLGAPTKLFYNAVATRTVVLGQEHLAGLPPTVIFAGTHRSFADTPLLRWAVTHSPARKLESRILVAIAAEGFLKTIWSRFGILAFGMVPLRRMGEGEGSLREIARLASLGNPVLIFPQGIHTTTEQELTGNPTARFRRGVAQLAGALHAPVVPFGVAGTEKRMPPDHKGFRGLVIAGIPLNFKRGPMVIAFAPSLTMAPDELPKDFALRLQEVCFDLTRRAEAALEREEKAHEAA